MTRVWKAQEKRAKLFKKQRGKCWLCGGQMNWRVRELDPDSATLDHVSPKSLRVGDGGPGNFKLAHKRCNEARGNRVDDIFVEIDGVRALRSNVKSVGS